MESGFAKEAALLTRHVEKRESDAALSWKEYFRIVKIQSPNMIQGLHPHQILGKLTSQTKTEDMKFAGKKDQS